MSSSRDYDGIDEATEIEDLEATLDPLFDPEDYVVRGLLFDEDVPDARVESDDVAEEPLDFSGPYDTDDSDKPTGEHIDFGCLLLPVFEGVEITYNPNDNYVEYFFPDVVATFRLHVLAVPKSLDMWESYCADMMLPIAQSGGNSRLERGDMGLYLQARLPGQTSVGVPVRHFGFDGPRWLLLVNAYDTAAFDDTVCYRFLRDILAGCIVNRGTGAHPPREFLPVTAPVNASMFPHVTIRQGE